MQTGMQNKKLLYIGLFAVAMAYVESAVVVYLRRLYGIRDLMTSVPPFDSQIGAIEVGRELATLVMLLVVGLVAGKKFQSRLGFAIFAFGLWDIFYYFWLKVFINWPKSFLDMDILFLFPLPWWGPVLAPMLIAALMAVGGARAAMLDESGIEVRFSLRQWAALGSGILILLYTFMADALTALPADTETLTRLKPTPFNWPAYLISLALASFITWRAFWPSVRRP